MKKKSIYRRSVLLTILTLCWNSIIAQDLYKKHLIMAFDNAFPTESCKDGIKDKNKVLTSVKKVLDENDIILGAEDCYSMVNYGINANEGNNDRLARIVTDRNGRKMAWEKYEGTNNAFSFTSNEWQYMIGVQGLEYLSANGSPYSLQSVAKAYIVKSLGRNDCKALSERIYLLQIKDDMYNGNDDVQKELKKFPTSEDRRRAFSEVVQKFNDSFVLKHLGSVYVESEVSNLQAILYEVIPNIRISVESSVSYPKDLGVKRVKGGFRMQFEFTESSQDYLIRQFQIVYKDKNGESYETGLSSGQYKDYEERMMPRDGSEETFNSNHVEIELDKDLFQDSVQVEVSAVLLQIDSIYNAAVLSAGNAKFSRLKNTYSIPLEDDVKIFSIIPLPDELWLFTDQADVAEVVWTMILVLLIMAVVVLIVTKMIKQKSVYRPENNKITIKLVDK